MEGQSGFMKREDGEDDKSHFYERYKEARREALGEKANGNAGLPKLDELVVKLKGQCSKVFEQIAATLRKSIRHSHVATLAPECGSEVMAMRVVAGEPTSDTVLPYEVYIATKASNSPHKMLLTSFESTGSAGPPCQTSQATIDYEGEVVDVQFIDDVDFLVLVAGEDGSGIWRCAVADRAMLLVHRFELLRRESRPGKMEVNGRKGRRVVCVLDADGMRYEIFDLDGGGDGEGEDREEDGEGMEE